MQQFQFNKAVRTQRKARIALCGPSGSGKTWTALELASGLKNGGRVCLLDSEDSSSCLYADAFDFDVLELPNHEINTYLAALDAADAAGFDVIVVDSASHAWESVLEAVDQKSKKNRGGNSFQSWGDVGTPLYKKFVERVLNSPAHVICTMRSKTDYVMEEYTDASGKKRSKPVKVGLAPIFRQGGEYEFDIVANIDLDHTLMVEKTRVPFLADKVLLKPTAALGREIRDWLKGGAPKPTEALQPRAASSAENLSNGAVRPAVTDAGLAAIHETFGTDNPWLYCIASERSPSRGKALFELSAEAWTKIQTNPQKALQHFCESDRAAIYACLANPELRPE